MTKTNRAREIASNWRSVAYKVEALVADFNREWNAEAEATRSMADWKDSEGKTAQHIREALAGLDTKEPAWLPNDRCIDVQPVHVDTAQEVANQLKEAANEFEAWASERKKSQ